MELTCNKRKALETLAIMRRVILEWCCGPLGLAEDEGAWLTAATNVTEAGICCICVIVRSIKVVTYYLCSNLSSRAKGQGRKDEELINGWVPSHSINWPH